MLLGARINSLDPDRPANSLLLAAVAIGVLQCFLDPFLRNSQTVLAPSTESFC